MSGLGDVLRADHGAIRATLVSHVEQQAGLGNPVLAQALGDHLGRAARTLGQYDDSGDDSPVRSAVFELLQLAGKHNIPFDQILAGVDRVAGAIRAQLVSRGEGAAGLLPLLDRVDQGVGLLHRLVVEAHLAREKAMLTSLVDESGDLLLLSSLTGKPLYVNQAGCRLLGLNDVNEARSRRLSQFYAEETWKRIGDMAVPAVKREGAGRAAANCSMPPRAT